jgi:hypothetical protein
MMTQQDARQPQESLTTAIKIKKIKIKKVGVLGCFIYYVKLKY